MLIKRIIMMLITFILAICLSILPLPNWANWLRPAWVTLVLCYWILTYPEYINVGIAWFLGLLLDALYGTVLGEHALALIITAYFMVRMQRLLKHYPVWQQGIFIVFCGFIYNFVLYVIQYAMGHGMNNWHFWISPLLSFILWPFLYEVFKRVQFNFKIQ